MKTKNLIQLGVILMASLALTFTSCKKDNIEENKADPSSMQQLSADENNVEKPDGAINKGELI